MIISNENGTGRPSGVTRVTDGMALCRKCKASDENVVILSARQV